MYQLFIISYGSRARYNFGNPFSSLREQGYSVARQLESEFNNWCMATAGWSAAEYGRDMYPIRAVCHYEGSEVFAEDLNSGRFWYFNPKEQWEPIPFCELKDYGITRHWDGTAVFCPTGRFATYLPKSQSPNFDFTSHKPTGEERYTVTVSPYTGRTLIVNGVHSVIEEYNPNESLAQRVAEVMRANDDRQIYTLSSEQRIAWSAELRRKVQASEDKRKADAMIYCDIQHWDD